MRRVISHQHGHQSHTFLPKRRRYDVGGGEGRGEFWGRLYKALNYFLTSLLVVKSKISNRIAFHRNIKPFMKRIHSNRSPLKLFSKQNRAHSQLYDSMRRRM